MDMGVIRSLKAHYRNNLVKKIIKSYDAEQGLPKISVLDAMVMAASAWESVSENTITNCFRKAKISPATQDAANNDSDDPFASLQSSMTVLNDLDSSLIPDGCNAENFVDCDNLLAVEQSENLSDCEIINSLTEGDVGQNSGGGDDDEIEIELACEPVQPTKPTRKELALAYSTLESYSHFVEPDQIAGYLRSLKNIENAVAATRQVQASITDFFK